MEEEILTLVQLTNPSMALGYTEGLAYPLFQNHEGKLFMAKHKDGDIVEWVEMKDNLSILFDPLALKQIKTKNVKLERRIGDKGIAIFKTNKKLLAGDEKTVKAELKKIFHLIKEPTAQLNAAEILNDREAWEKIKEISTKTARRSTKEFWKQIKFNKGLTLLMKKKDPRLQ
jgi:hypothetical protein